MVKEKEEEILCIGGDFNVRIGREGKNYEGENDKDRWRNSKDKVVNNEGRELIGLLEERGWKIGNGNMRGDEVGELTYERGRGTSVVDYLVVNQDAWDRISRLKVGERVESDHQSLEVELRREMEREEEKIQKKTKEVIQWDEKEIKRYKKRGMEAEIIGVEVEDIWKNLEKVIGESEERKRVKMVRRKIGEKEWWKSATERKGS